MALTPVEIRHLSPAKGLLGYKRAQTATKEGLFKPEIVAVQVTPPGAKDPIMFSEDEEPFNATAEELYLDVGNEARPPVEAAGTAA